MDEDMDFETVPKENFGNDPTKAKKKFVHPKKTADERKSEKEKRKLRKARVILRNLPFKISESDLSKEFSKYGPIKECNILKREDGKLVGCAFIQYDKVNHAAKAIHHANGKDLFGRPVIIDFAVNRKKFVQHIRQQKELNNQVKVKNEDDTESMEIKQESEDENSANESEDNNDDEHSEEEASEGGEPDDDNENDDDEEEEDVKDEKKPIHQKSNDVAEGCTVFIKNIPFECTNDDLYKVCRQFGPLYYAVITVDKVSGHSKGNGFVKYRTKESADMCLNAGTTFKLLHQILDPQPALSRNEIQQKKTGEQKQPRDSRNLYLSKEGTILAGTPAAEGVSASDLAKRLRLEQSKNQSLRNLNRFVSKERVTIHNIPPSYDDAKLRKAVVKACGLKPKECRVMRENKPSLGHPNGKSKGYGFLSFKSHDEALNCLRKVNNNPKVFGKNNRPILSFSIEDRAVHNIKMKRMLKSQQKNPLCKKKNVNSKNNNNNETDVKPNAKALKKLKKKSSKNETNENGDIKVAEFAGTTAEEGSKYKTRPQWKLREDNVSHSRMVKAQKKMLRKQKIQRDIRNEKRQIDRTKMKKRNPKDVDSSLVNKYLKILHSKDESPNKPKRSKWYID
ncbi:RNA-binding protein 28 [Contarinia nasturtii]|uniref:RNA-binding protein 28 n=1 Tax=Contarinia nasturtii TaxID=265458 RepID=UPI0012D3D8A9|nr:RNA-binding protein 28 [Contarinia nasturtii]